MAVRDDIKWFKRNFAAEVREALTGTPLTLDLLCAIALQETGYIWRKLVARGLPMKDVLRLSVGDTLDAPRRSAFPRNKAALVARENGQQMFELAHDLLVEMGEATGIQEYINAGRNPNKFCHGYGIFQRDLQFYKEDPDYFLSQAWADFSRCLDEAVKELKKGLRNLGYHNLSSLSDRQLCYVAIVYNTGFGNFDEDRGLKQGFEDENGVYYGEHIARFLEASKAVPTPATEPEDEDVGTGPGPVGTGTGGGTTRSVVDVAQGELATYGGIAEGDEPLRSHIDDYWRAANANPAHFSPTEDAWSAAFVSYCVRRSGATQDQFNFNIRHSEFVFTAIKNEEHDRGDFRGYAITEYAPKIGDIIQNNQPGYDFSFSYARTHSQYPSHSAIVVGFETRNGVRHAITIGGNESNTVGRKLVPLTAGGFVRQRANTNHYISILENRMAGGAGTGPRLPGRYVVRARPDLNLRAGPDTTFTIKQVLDYGTILHALEFVDTPRGVWALVDLEGDGGRDGYVFASYLVPA
ncbi:DUF2272 domain-containing protein [Sinorhizobium sp. BG8]|uniref:DUF2272 domain-containing protein n=1 Tax=Sinorhizobium sp. BG8 TaxID=2613773 RepID=UPI00193E29F1|nr:DUF2272 domain-containing protein [Sinorhizobium sp. BG8]